MELSTPRDVLSFSFSDFRILNLELENFLELVQSPSRVRVRVRARRETGRLMPVPAPFRPLQATSAGGPWSSYGSAGGLPEGTLECETRLLTGTPHYATL